MITTYVLQCGDCPHYRPSVPTIGGHSSDRKTADQCTHPDTASGIANPFLNGPSVMPPQCPMIRTPTVYRAVRREMKL